jgi:hypothetical protein
MFDGIVLARPRPAAAGARHGTGDHAAALRPADGLPPQLLALDTVPESDFWAITVGLRADMWKELGGASPARGTQAHLSKAPLLAPRLRFLGAAGAMRRGTDRANPWGRDY